MNNTKRAAPIDGDGRLAGPAAVGSAAGDGEVVGLAGGPGGDGLALRGVEQGQVALAGEVGAVGFQRGCHAVVGAAGAGVGVGLGFERRRVAHLHVGGCGARCGESESEEVLEVRHLGWLLGFCSFFFGDGWM